MKFTVASAVAFLAAGAFAAPAALEARVPIDGCPAWAPYPMGSPGDYWYPICCVYVIGDGTCCNRHPENGITYAGKPYPACPKP
ncbi:hypothetical protein RB595_010712 [Gaeumannomyces hyphopodioides]